MSLTLVRSSTAGSRGSAVDVLRCDRCGTFWQPESVERGLRFDREYRVYVCRGERACARRAAVRASIARICRRRLVSR